MSLYAPLWCKSNYSFLEGASHPDELVDEACRLGLPAIALTNALERKYPNAGKEWDGNGYFQQRVISQTN